MARYAKNHPGESIPDQAGTYVLIVEVDGAFRGQVGKLGEVVLPEGIYAYVGSAHGSGGLRARVLRHLRADKCLHWHIDTLTELYPVREVWVTMSPDRLECRWSRLLENLPGIDVPAPGFGSSDCDCQSHLYAIPELRLDVVWESLGCPDRVTIDQL
ncbi:MAG: GIY-YIG nuclease family protein [Anaerolineae bacterium]|nr:GIY-YIG nuclease family protein [Anaerolineae bacterium]